MIYIDKSKFKNLKIYYDIFLPKLILFKPIRYCQETGEVEMNGYLIFTKNSFQNFTCQLNELEYVITSQKHTEKENIWYIKLNLL